MLVQSFASLVKLSFESRHSTSTGLHPLAPVEVRRVDGSENRFRGVPGLFKVGFLVFVEMLHKLFARPLEVFQLPSKESGRCIFVAVIEVSEDLATKTRFEKMQDSLVAIRKRICVVNLFQMHCDGLIEKTAVRIIA
jgi:hypothetical protein